MAGRKKKVKACPDEDIDSLSAFRNFNRRSKNQSLSVEDKITFLKSKLSEFKNSSSDETSVKEDVEPEQKSEVVEVKIEKSFSKSLGKSFVKKGYPDMSLLPLHKVERMIYRAFRYKFENWFSSSSEGESDAEDAEPHFKLGRSRSGPRKPRQQRRNANTKIGSGFYSKRKRRRLLQRPSLYPEGALDSMSEGMDNSEELDNSDQEVESEKNSDDGEVDESLVTDDFEPSNYDHDYSTTEFAKIAEANADALAFETENMYYNDDADCCVVTGEFDSSVITLDSTTETPTEKTTVVVDDDEIMVIGDNDDDCSLDQTNFSDHIYCVSPEHEKLKKNKSSSSAVSSSEVVELDGDGDVVNKVPETGEKLKTLSTPNTPQKRIWECPICLEQSTGQEIATTLCGHIFCKDCIESYIGTCEKCPTCRTNLTGKPLITLFNFV